MEIETICPNCKRVYKLDSQYEGSMAECETCHATFMVARSEAKTSKTAEVQSLSDASNSISRQKVKNHARMLQKSAAMNIESSGGRLINSDFLIILTGTLIVVKIWAIIRNINAPALLVVPSIVDLLWYVAFLVFVYQKSKQD